MGETIEFVKKTHVQPEGLSKESFLLSPNDILHNFARVVLAFPLFFDYDIGHDQVVEGVKKFLQKWTILSGRIRPDPHTRYVVEVDPSDASRMGVPVTEQRSDMSVATAILHHSKIKANTAKFPVYGTVPALYANQDHKAVLRGEAPLMSIVMTHLNGGCVMSIAIQHVIVDGQRLAEAYRDLGMCVRGVEIADRDHDRSVLWPDQVAKKFPDLGEQAANMPRMVLPEGEAFQDRAQPDDTSETVCMHFPSETVEKMKSMVAPFLSKGEYVSTSDVVTAFLWMFICETIEGEGEKMTGADLDIDDTFMFMTYEMLNNGMDIIPKNYSGNAFIMQLMKTAPDVKLAEAPLPHVFAVLAITIRKTLLFIKQQQILIAQFLISYAVFEATAKLPIELDMSRFRALVSNLVKTPFKDVDFGNGPPVWMHLQGNPLSGDAFFVGPAPGSDGLICHGQLSSRQVARLKNSAIRDVVAPEMKEVYSEYTVDQLAAKLKR